MTSTIPSWIPPEYILPESISYQRAIWGKAHGASSDYRWLAATEGFNRSKNLDQQFSLSGIDKNSELLFWRCLEENNQRRYFAGHVYPSQARDAAGRGDILERQLLECCLKDNEFIPYIALYLLKTVNDWRDDIWWSRRDEIDWVDENNLLLLEDAKTLAMPKDLVAKALEQGIDELNQLNIKEELTNFYARLLSGEKISILYSRTALSPNALAALLLPIEQKVVNSLSILVNVPSISPSEIENLRLHWDVLVLLSKPNADLSLEARKQYAQSERMAQALLENNQKLLLPNNEITPVEVKEEINLEQQVVSKPEEKAISEQPVEKELEYLPTEKIFYQLQEYLNLPNKPDENTFEYHIYKFAAQKTPYALTEQILGDARKDKTDTFNQPQFAKTVKEWIEFLEEWINSVDKQMICKDQWQIKLEQLKALAFALHPIENVNIVIGNKIIPPLFYWSFMYLQDDSWKKFKNNIDIANWKLIKDSSLEFKGITNEAFITWLRD